MVAGSLGEKVRGEITILASVPELVTCEVTISGTPGDIGIFGIAELVSVPRLVSIEAVLSKSLWKTFGVVLGTVGLDSAGRVMKETFVSDSCRDSVRVEKIVLVLVPELVTKEVTIDSTSSETVFVGVAELTPAPGLVAVKDIVSNSLWEKFRVFLEIELLVFGE